MKLIQTRIGLGSMAFLTTVLVGTFLLIRSIEQTAVIAAEGEKSPLKDEGAAGLANLDKRLTAVLKKSGFTGRIESTLEKRLGRKVNQELADLGNLLFFDKILALGNDNSCAGCHTPGHGFGDSQSIAIGIGNNDVVGPGRKGPRNQRRTPLVINNAFYPKLMWNGRFAVNSGDPFDNSDGFEFPPPEGDSSNPDDRFFPAKDPHLKHLLVAQAHIPPTELPEMAAFNIEMAETFRFPRFGGQRVRLVDVPKRAKPNPIAADVLPHPISGFFNEPIRKVVLLRLNANPEYRKLFAKHFPNVGKGDFITFEMVGNAIAEFEISLTHAIAPIDKFAQGDLSAMTPQQKRGALLFFRKAGCVQCHSVAGRSNEMFSDFEMHVIGVPQIAPKKSQFGGDSSDIEVGNFEFKGPGNNEDFGLEEITNRITDRYKFRTSPLRNVAVQPTFSHNGAWTRLEDVIRHHLNPPEFARKYDPAAAGVAEDLRKNMGPIEPVLMRLSPLLAQPVELSASEFNDLVAFVHDGLLDSRAKPEELCKKIPQKVPSGKPLPKFEGCDEAGA